MTLSNDNMNTNELYSVESNSSLKQYIDNLLFDNPESSTIFFVSECMNHFSYMYPEMTLREWHEIINDYIEKKESWDEEELDIDNEDDIANNLENNLLQDASAYSDVESNYNKSLFKRYLNGDKKAFDLLVMNNIPLVKSIANSMMRDGLEFEDLFQEGTIGLIRAIQKYNYRGSGNFIKYASLSIVHYILNYTQYCSNMVKIPFNLGVLHKKVKNLVSKFEVKNEYLPSISDIELDASFDALKFVYQMPDNLSDLVCLIDNLDIYEHYNDVLNNEEEAEYIKYYLHALLKYISYRERVVVNNYYGIDTEEKSLKEIGSMLSLTRERVRQILVKAMEKMSKIARRHDGLYYKDIVNITPQTIHVKIRPALNISLKNKIVKEKRTSPEREAFVRSFYSYTRHS